MSGDFVSCSLAGLLFTPLLAQDSPPAPPPAAANPTATIPKSGDIDLATLMNLKVATASKFEQPISRVPSSVSIVKREDIERYGYRTLADILRSLRGLHVSSDRVYGFLGTRGVNPGDFNGRILLMVDGHRVNQNLSDAASIDSGFILDVDLIDRVEFIRGSGSTVYGNNAFFGVINVITRTGREFSGVGGEAAAAYGSFDTWQARASYGHRFENGLDLVLSGTWFDSQGESPLYYREFDTPANNGGHAVDVDADAATSGFATVRYKEFSLQGAIVSREKQNPTAQHGTTFNDPRHEYEELRAYLDLKYENSFGDDWSVLARSYYDRYEFDGTFPFTEGQVTLEQDDRLGEWFGVEGQVSKRIEDRHMVSLGAEYRQDFAQDRIYRQVEPVEETLADVGRDRSSYAVYLNGEAQLIADKLTFNAGVRYDNYPDFDDSVNPRLALIYNPWRESAIKAIYGTAFRVPNFYELFDPANQDIAAEEIDSYELVYEQNWGGNWRSTVALFYNVIDDAIAFDFASSNPRYRNFTGAEARGAEFEVEVYGREGWSEWMRARLSYGFQDTEDRDSGQRLTDSPEHLLKLNLTAPIWREWVFGGVEVQYQSERETIRVLSGGVVARGGEADDVVLVNATLLTRDWVKGLSVSAGVYNLTDERYSDPGTPWHVQNLLEQSGRTFRVKVSYRF